MNRRLRLVLVALLLMGSFELVLTSGAGAAVPAPPDLQTVVVTLPGRVDPATIPGTSRPARLRKLIRALQARADADQAPLRRFLRTRQAQGLVTDITPLWIVNAVSVTATSEVIAELAARSDIKSVGSDEAPLVPSAAAAEPGVTAVQAPAVWQLGDTGTGVVVATLDSGVDLSHPDLAGRWRGGTNSWFDPYGEHPSTPTDLTGHGTGTMGIILGGDSGGTSIGVAPGASWISAKIFDDHGLATTTAVHQAFQWVLDPDGDPATADAPQVVNGSWSLGTSPGCDLTYQPDVQALRAAGILPVFAAGNFGSRSSTSVSPGNYPESLSVGALNANGSIWSGSSRGPSSCGGRSLTRPFPDVVAPGTNVTTADRYGFFQTRSGTSFAAPHAAGALALLLSSHPGLTPDQQWTALTASATDLGPTGPDQVYGYGRVDALGALTSFQSNADTVGPTTSGGTATPGLGTGSSPVTVSAEASDAQSGGTDVVAAEYFVDAIGADGSGTAIPLGVPAPTVSLSTDLSPELLGTLSQGTHTVWLHAQDAAGNWGGAVSAAFVLDGVAPSLTSPTAGPSPTQGATSVDLYAGVEETGSGLSRAEWFAGTDPGLGNAAPMTIGGSGPYTLSAAVDVSAWPVGSRTITLRAQDAAGNWSDAVTVSVEVTTASAGMWFSTLGSSKLPGVTGTADDADVYQWNAGGYSREWDASVAGLPSAAKVDGYDRVDATHFYLSFAATTTAVPGLGLVDDEDVVLYANGVWSLWFDGGAHGLTATAQDLDAISVQGGSLYFSTVGNAKLPGVLGAGDDADIYSWDGSRFVRVWDASAAGLPSAANVDGYVRVDATHFYLSFSPTTTSVPGLGSVQDEDVIYTNGSAWSTYFDGTAHGLTSDALDVDAFDVS